MPAPQRQFNPPSPRHIEHYARALCLHLGEDFQHEAIIDGLATFLKHAFRVYADASTRAGHHLFDNQQDSE